MENESLRSEHCKRFEYQQTIEKITHKNVEKTRRTTKINSKLFPLLWKAQKNDVNFVIRKTMLNSLDSKSERDNVNKFNCD